jgi:hypothetical protein
MSATIRCGEALRPGRLGRGACLAAALMVIAVLARPVALWAQEAEARAQLAQRGLPPELAQGVAALVADAGGRGLPTDPLVDKALEGWAKHAPPAQILNVVSQFAGRMGVARDAVTGAGIATPPGEVVSAAAEAMGRGISGPQVAQVVRAAPQAPLAAPGLRVAAALTAQGLSSGRAVNIVADALRSGRNAAQILDLPSVMRTMQSQGMSGEDIGQRMLREGEGPGHGGGMRSGPGSGSNDQPLGPGSRSGRGRDGRGGGDDNPRRP